MSACMSRVRRFLNVERLEDRALPSTIQTQLNGSTLTIFGTGGNDVIEVERVGQQIRVRDQVFDAASVRLIVVDAGDGDDVVTVSRDITATTWLYGRLGNDRLTGGGGRNYLYGGRGDDVLIGGAGPNVLVGGSGTNLIHANFGDEVIQGQPNPQLALSGVAQQILTLVNQHRQAAGLPALRWNGSLAYAADVHSRNMAALSASVGPTQAMAHLLLGVNAPTLGSRADLAGYDYRALGENLAWGFPNLAAVVDAWMNSPGHRANILNASFSEIGIAVAYSSQGIPFYTQFFGNPDNPAPATNTGSNSGSPSSPSTSQGTSPSDTTTGQPITLTRPNVPSWHRSNAFSSPLTSENPPNPPTRRLPDPVRPPVFTLQSGGSSGGNPSNPGGSNDLTSAPNGGQPPSVPAPQFQLVAGLSRNRPRTTITVSVPTVPSWVRSSRFYYRALVLPGS